MTFRPEEPRPRIASEAGSNSLAAGEGGRGGRGRGRPRLGLPRVGAGAGGLGCRLGSEFGGLVRNKSFF